MIDEGYVKFNVHWQIGPAPAGIEDLVSARNELHRLGWIGIYADSGIGFGNVSMRIGDSEEFVVSGTSTGGIHEVDAKHFCTITAWNANENSVSCIGPVSASSESMTHAMLYGCSKEIHAILHIHHLGFWEWLLDNGIASSPQAAYGTPAMAYEMARMLKETDLARGRILAMGGHSEGVIAFGRNLAEAMGVLIKKMGEWRGGN